MIYMYVFILVLSIASGWAMLWNTPKLALREKMQKQKKQVSIIIPARNEEKNLPILLASVQKQTYKPLEILVIDDYSEDQTAQVAREYGATVVQVQRDEREWFGKAAACWYGAQAAAGDTFLFLDADIFFPGSDSLERMIANFQEESVLSIQPYHTIRKSYENFSVIFNILVLAGMNQFSILGKRLPAAGAFGPTLLCSRNSYFQVGGHKRVRHNIMENIALGQVFIEQEFPVQLYSGKNILHFRMYPDGIAHLFEGWSKSFASGSVATHLFIMICSGLWISGAFISGFYLIFSGFQLLAWMGYLAFFLSFLRMARIAGNFSVLLSFFYPLLFSYFVCVFIWSAIKTFVLKSVSWKGRKIEL